MNKINYNKNKNTISSRHRPFLSLGSWCTGRALIALMTLIIFYFFVGIQEAQAAAPSNEWWDSNYGFRKKISITAGSTAVPSGYSVSFSDDTATLITDTKLRSDGNDWRIVYWNGSSWDELDRWVDDIIGDGWNSANTKTWFKTQASISASSSDDNYYVYYGYADETQAAPAYMSDSMGADAASEVFWYADDFEEHASNTDPDGWTDQGTEDFKVMLQGSEKWFQRTTRIVWNDGSTASSMANVGDAVWSAKLYYHQSGSNAWGGIGVHIATGSVGRTVLVRDQAYYHADETISGGSWIANTDIHFPLGTKGRIELITNGTNLDAYWYNPSGYSPDKVTLFTGYTMLSGTGKLGVYVESPDVGNDRWIDEDDIIVRQYVSPEPTTSLSTEEQALSKWGYRKKIVIDSTKVYADLPDFPFLINLSSDSDLASYAQNDGDDILFTLSTVGWDTGTNSDRLDHEIEDFDGSTGELIAWVRIPSLSSTTDTEIFMYYGNSGISNQQNPTGVWDSNYVAVWHLEEDPTGTIYDSTSNNNDGTTYGTMTSTDLIDAKIGKGLDLDGTDDYIQWPLNNGLNITGNQITLSGWARTPAAGVNDDEALINKVGSGYPYMLGMQDSADLNNDLYNARVYNGTKQVRIQPISVPRGEWVYLAMRYDGSNVYAYVNGSQVGTDTLTGNIVTGTAVYSGRRADTRRYEGDMDELRVSNIARSVDWLSTEYNNQNSPSTFYSVGSEEDYASFGIFSYRTMLTIDSDKVCGSSGSHPDFPVLVLIQNNNDLKTWMNGGKVYNDSGYDIIFRAFTGNTQLYHEVEKYDGSAGTLIAWVKIPTLSKGSDTKFYMYYGNASITSATHEPDKVWNSNYVTVWHLKETTGGTNAIKDSTNNANHGTDFNSPTFGVTGKIGNAIDFDGLDDYATMATSGFNPSAGAVEVWVDIDTFPPLNGTEYPFSHHATPTANRIYIFTINDAGTNKWGTGMGDAYQLALGSVLSVDTWYHLAITWDGTYVRGYKDGSLDFGPTAYSGLTAISNTWIGSWDGTSEYHDGILDELRVSSTVRDSEWICTEYNNMKWPNKTDWGTDGFITVGSAEDIECSYSYYKEISIQSSQVGTSCSSDLSDFPMLVSLTGNWLKTTTVDSVNGRIKNHPDGYDIIFRDLYGTLLDHEIEDYDEDNGKLIAWVRIPTLKYNEDTVIYMYYGNSCISSSTENPTGVWDSNYRMVQHMNDATSSTIEDSTSYNNNGTKGSSNNPDEVSSGKIGNAQDFDSNSEYIALTDSSTWTWTPVSQARTLSFWFRCTARPTIDGDPFQFIVTTGAPGNRYQALYARDSTPISAIAMAIFDNAWNPLGYYFVNWNPTLSTWYHITFVASSAGNNKIFIDGVDTSVTELSWDDNTSINPSSTGIKDTTGNSSGRGYIDEMRFSHSVRDACWIETCFNNQSSPSTFYIVGDEEDYSPTAVGLISFTATGQDDSVLVEWETAQEINNLGFNLYRGSEPYGSYTQLNSRLIPGLISSVSGQQYTYTDTDVTRGVLYYYLLEDVDLSGIRTMHGPVCVDWDGDGIPDDYDEELDDDSDEDTGEGDPEVEIPLLELYEVDLGHEDWTPSGSSSSWVKLESFRVRQEDEGVALEWETSFEVDNLGFHIYREADGKFYRITPSLVPGSVFKVGAGKELPAGQSYLYWDGLSACTGHELYWLDSVELNGGRASFGPIKPEIYGQPVLKRLKARFKSITEYQISRARALRKIRALREELSTRSTQKMKSQAIFYSIVPVKSSEPRLPPSEEQWALSGQPGVKIYIKEEGWYRVGEPELVAAGLRPGVDPRYLQLYADGEEQSMMVMGGDDGRFDPDDTIEFYGTGLDTPFTDARVYWLVVGSRPGRRLETPFTDIRIGPDKRMRVPRGLRGRGAPLSFPYTVELKERTFYFAALKNGERESFFGSVISTEPVDQLLTVAHPDPSPPEEGMLEVVLQGATDFSHQIKIQLNYVEIGQVVFSGQELWRAEISIPQGYLLEGDNIITLAAQGGSLDVSLVDYIRLTYWRTYTADEDSLQFKASGREWLSIGGFSSPGIRVLDITDPLRMLNVRGKVKTQDSGYAITFKVPMGGERTLLVFTEEKIKGPAGMAANLASSWHVLGQQGAEVIIIGHRDLLESVRSLRELREQQGWSVVLVDVEDLYDEFNFGAKSPWALKDFLDLAYEYWNPQPRFLLLVGDTSYDPRNYLGLGEFDLVPTKFVDTEYLKTASDDWFVDFDDDGLPEMAVGRLPVEDAEEGAAVVSKIISYEGVAGLMSEALLVADVNAGFDYEGATADVRSLLPGDITVREIFRGQSPTARSDLLDLLNQGQLLVNYFGHGSTKTWKGNLLTYSDAWNLTNSPYLPFFVNMTCLNGFFQDPYNESLAEALLKTERGGALAVWTSSGLTYPGGQISMNKELIRLLFNGQGLTIGEAIIGAKQAVNNQDIRRTWILFGDPMIKLR